MNPRIVLQVETANLISEVAKISGEKETGGILVGYYENEDLIVSHILEVSSSKPSRHCYVRDDLRAQDCLQRFLSDRAEDDPAGYIGEWHSHPGRSAAGPSDLDLKVISELSAAKGRRLALLVARTRFDDLFGVIAYEADGNHLTSFPARKPVFERPADGVKQTQFVFHNDEIGAS